MAQVNRVDIELFEFAKKLYEQQGDMLNQYTSETTWKFRQTWEEEIQEGWCFYVFGTAPYTHKRQERLWVSTRIHA